MKRFLTLMMVLVVLCIAALPAIAEEPVTLRVCWWGSQTRHDVTMRAIEKFEEKYPHITVEAEFTDWSGYWSKLATQVAGGMMPDVIQMDYMYLAQYAQSGVLAEMTPFYESGAIDITNVAESMLASGVVDGKNYALAAGTNSMATVYRQDVLDEAGLTMPENLTMEALSDLAAQVYAKTGRTMSIGADITALTILLRSYGYQLYDGNKLGFDNPEYIVKLWEDRLAGVEAGWCLPIGETTAVEQFDTLVSDTWATQIWTNQIAAYENGSGCELNLAYWPVHEDSTTAPLYFKPSMFWSIAEGSEVTDAAALFVNYMTNDPDYFDIVGTERAMPASSEMTAYIRPTLDPASQKVAEYMDYLSQDGRTTPIMAADPVASGEIMTLFDEYFEAVQYGQVDDLTAWAQEFMDEANALLAKDAQE